MANSLNVIEKLYQEERKIFDEHQKMKSLVMMHLRQMEQKPTIILLFGRRKILTPKQTLYIPRSRVKSRIMKHN